LAATQSHGRLIFSVDLYIFFSAIFQLEQVPWMW